MVIIVSILLAFWIDAWWDGRQEHEDERTILMALLGEFQQIRQNIDDVQTYQVAIRESAISLIKHSVDTDPSVAEEEIDRLLEQQLWISSPANFAAPELEAVISRGGMALVSSRDLRLLLQSWPAKFDWIASAMQEDLDFVNRDLGPFLSENTSFLQLMESGTHRPGDSTFSRPERQLNVAERISHKELMNNRQLKNMLLTRVDLLDDIISLARDDALPDRVDETVALLKKELSE